MQASGSARRPQRGAGTSYPCISTTYRTGPNHASCHVVVIGSRSAHASIEPRQSSGYPSIRPPLVLGAAIAYIVWELFACGAYFTASPAVAGQELTRYFMDCGLGLPMYNEDINLLLFEMRLIQKVSPISVSELLHPFDIGSGHDHTMRLMPAITSAQISLGYKKSPTIFGIPVQGTGIPDMRALNFLM